MLHWKTLFPRQARYRLLMIVLAVIALGLPLHLGAKAMGRGVGWQVSTLDALSAGVYQGAATFQQVRQHGDFGLGTFAGLDGEMIGLGGQFYQVKDDGLVQRVTDQTTTPFAVVTQFHPQRTIRLSGRFSYPELQRALDQQLPSLNYPYALKIQGTFPQLQVRSVPGQDPPYPPLSDVVAQQSLFQLGQQRVTLVGFRLPQNMQGINAAGYHFHAINAQKTGGGHVLGGEFVDPEVQVQALADWQIQFPDDPAFAQAPLATP